MEAQILLGSGAQRFRVSSNCVDTFEAIHMPKDTSPGYSFFVFFFMPSGKKIPV